MALLLTGCSGSQSALDPAGPQSGRISNLFWLYGGVAAIVYVSVMAVLLVGIARRRRPRRTAPMLTPPAGAERRLRTMVASCLGLTAVVLLVLMAAEFLTGRAMHAMAEADALTIRITGHQWWWEVQYRDPTPSQMVTTANEIHIPVGRTVRFELRSADVIHSFWVPNLHGKRDLIPNHPAQVYLRADRAGTFRGQCAEFCGQQHAFMRFVLVAEPEADFRRWLDARRQPAREPTTDRQRRGRQVFLATTCVMCHAIQGTPARSRVGPDLTHVGSRPLIAGILPNARGHLAGWIVDPQSIKPGVRMPMNLVRPADLDDLLDYLSSLD